VGETTGGEAKGMFAVKNPSCCTLKIGGEEIKRREKVASKKRRSACQSRNRLTAEKHKGNQGPENEEESKPCCVGN